jgi:DNA-binding MltR family transcriptional regulator
MGYRDFKMRISPDVIWHVADDFEEELLEKLEHDSDRAAGIIAASMIEARMEGFLQMLMQRDKIIEERLFKPSGPLGSFSAKIDLFFILNLISKKAHTDLVIIKNVRNDFAHRLKIRDFMSPSIRDKVKNLSLVETHVTHGDRNKKGDNVITLGIPVAVPFMWLPQYNEAKADPRKRYLMACSIFVNAFMGIKFHDWLAGGVRPVV